MLVGGQHFGQAELKMFWFFIFHTAHPAPWIPWSLLWTYTIKSKNLPVLEGNSLFILHHSFTRKPFTRFSTSHHNTWRHQWRVLHNVEFYFLPKCYSEFLPFLFYLFISLVTHHSTKYIHWGSVLYLYVNDTVSIYYVIYPYEIFTPLEKQSRTRKQKRNM